MRTMNSITAHTDTMNRKVRSITRSTVRERTVRERTVRRVRLHYSFPPLYEKENYGNQIKTVKIWIELSKHGNELEPSVLWKKWRFHGEVFHFPVRSTGK